MRASLLMVFALVGCAGDLATSSADTLPAPVAGQLPLPQPMTLFVNPAPVAAGRWIDLTVAGATPGATVGLAVSNGVSGAGACPGWIGDCLDITPGTSGYRFIVLGTADAFGNVVASTTLPRTLAGGTWAFQALSNGGAGGSFVGSAPLAVDILPFRPSCPNDDLYENDDTSITGHMITVGHTSTGRVVCEQDDIDWHRIQLAAGESVVFQADFVHAEGDIDLYVMDAPSLNNLSYLNTNYLARGYSSSDQELVPFTAPADGTYYVGVRLYEEYGTSPGNTYSFRVDHAVQTCTIGFDDAYAIYGDAADPTLYYSPYGVQFTMTSGYGLIGGQANGDSSHWTDDPAAIPDAAWGCWDDTNSEVNTIAFASPASNVTATVYAGNSGSPQTLIVEGFYQGTSIGWTPYLLDYAGPISQVISVPGPVDSIQFNIQSGSFAYSIDNVQYDAALACP